MQTPRAYGSGVIGTAGRTPAADDVAEQTPLRLDGELLPLVGVARLYVCGITPYDVTHLGHAATFVWADALAAAIGLTGATASTCRNVTDVDDVLTRAAEGRGRHYDEFALTQEFLFHRHMTSLRVKPPNHEPRARHHILTVQQLAAALLNAGHAYEREGHVFFRGNDLWARSGLGRDEALSLSRQDGDTPDDPLRDDPFDVPVWRPSSETDPAWPSPWGWGRPGWHAECAAMALAVHGPSVDVLVGGSDLSFPHHAYQTAMAESATSVRPFARRALHVGAVHQDGTKMAKATGNLTLVDTLLANHPAGAVRLLLLDRPWYQSWEYRSAELQDAGARLDRLHSAAGKTTASASATQEVRRALVNDLDVTRALDIAEESGGEPGRSLISLLQLS
ncbi:MAG: cysteine--tRNA ligase [Nocardioidaceae bacterium]|nr:cysteine--tRNA ligase [Nocardioidaceae bacterium]